MANSEKSHDRIPRKQSDRRQEGKLDRPYFIRFFQLPLGGLLSTTEVDWHLKVKAMNCDLV